MGIEIEISTKLEHIKEQIKKDATFCDLVVVGCKKEIVKKVQAIVNSLNQKVKDKVKICLPQELLEENILKKQING